GPRTRCPVWSCEPGCSPGCPLPIVHLGSGEVAQTVVQVDRRGRREGVHTPPPTLRGTRARRQAEDAGCDAGFVRGAFRFRVGASGASVHSTFMPMAAA